MIHIDIFKAIVSIVGLLSFLASWYAFSSKKKRVSHWSIPFGIVAGLMLLMLFFLLTQASPFSSPTPIQPSPSFMMVYDGYSQSPVSRACPTSKAIGASGKKTFIVPHLQSDGKTDNAPAIQATIEKASNAGGGIVNLPAGVFLINKPIVMYDNVTLSGAGPQTVLQAGSRFLKGLPSNGYSIVTTDGASNITIRHLTADQQGNKLDGNAIDRFFGYVIHVYKSNNVIVNGVYTRNPFAYAIVAEESSHFCFINNNTQVDTSGKYDQLDGIHVLNSAFGDVINNYVDQGNGQDGDDGLVAHTIGGKVHDIMYAKNKVRGGKGGSGMQLALTEPSDEIYKITIQNNEFWGSPRGIRTGYYGGPNGSVHDIIIGGGAKKGNYIHDNTFNDTKTGDAINIYGNGIDPYNITVSYNSICNAGSIAVGKGKNNFVQHNNDCSNSN